MPFGGSSKTKRSQAIIQEVAPDGSLLPSSGAAAEEGGLEKEENVVKVGRVLIIPPSGDRRGAPF